MKRVARVCLILCLWIAVCFAQAESVHEVLYFYENYCETCRPEEDFAADFRALTGFDLGQCAFEGHNVVTRAGQAALDAAQAQYGMEEILLPLAIVDGKVYAGANALNFELPRDSLALHETADSVILYLYAPACESCARAAAVLDALPETVSVRRGTFTFESRVRVEKIDVSANPAIADALFETYEVPDARRIVPSVFFSDRYLSGIDEIERDLSLLVRIGRASGGTRLSAGSRIEGQNPAVDVLLTLSSGLTAGLNPCALSMLLLFLSAVPKAGRRGGQLCFCFLAAKFVCYLLIGFGLLSVLQRMNPVWLRPLARWLMTVVGLVLAGLNLWDAWQVRRARYGKVRNQLPSKMRSWLRRAVGQMTAARALVPSVAALGIVTALGEFLCAGQLYLMRLLAAVQANPSGQGLHLVLYCLAFIAPSAIVSAIVLKSCSQLRASAFFAEHMAPVKLVTALVMLALIAAAWMM